MTSQEPKLRCIEFFSGIGGWSRALHLSSSCYSSSVEVCCAYDVNPHANAVYEHNYPDLKVCTRSIVNVTTKEVESLEANMWVMSPPCQPFTRNNETQSRDTKDTRSDALKHLIHILQETKQPPIYIALENVVGFEVSDCCKLLLQTLEAIGYECRQYHLTPTQFGIPNERPRYYLTASLVKKKVSTPVDASVSNIQSKLHSSSYHERQRELKSALDGYQNPTTTLTVSSFINASDTNDSELVISDEILNKNSSWCFDIVHPDAYVTSCFTKSYSRYSKGTGSILLINAPTDRTDLNTNTGIEIGQDGEDQNNCDSKRKQRVMGIEDDDDNDDDGSSNGNGDDFLSSSLFFQELSKSPGQRSFSTDWVQRLKEMNKSLRYFSPNELLTFFTFNAPMDRTTTTEALSKLEYATAQSFHFPEGISQRKQYELIGNSVNVCVIAHVLIDLFKLS